MATVTTAPATTPIPDYVRRAFAPNPYRERVERGAALLDSRVPRWWQRIDLDRLDIHDECGCVLGQLFGRYAIGFGRVMADPRGASDHGFTIRSDYESWDDLTATWREYLTERAA